MRAIVYTELDSITLQDLPVPEVGAQEVLVRTRASGICQTDVEVLKGHYGNSTFPLVRLSLLAAVSRTTLSMIASWWTPTSIAVPVGPAKRV